MSLGPVAPEEGAPTVGARPRVRHRPVMRRIPLDSEAVHSWVLGACLHPNSNWYTPIFDVRRRSFFYLTRRNYIAIDEPNKTLSPALDRVLTRFERGDRTLQSLPRMPDEERVTLLLTFIVAQPEIETRDALLRRFAERPSIVFGHHPWAIFNLVDVDADGQETPLGRAFREHIEKACAPHVKRTLRMLGYPERPFFHADLG